MMRAKPSVAKNYKKQKYKIKKGFLQVLVFVMNLGERNLVVVALNLAQKRIMKMIMI